VGKNLLSFSAIALIIVDFPLPLLPAKIVMGEKDMLPKSFIAGIVYG